MTMRTTWGLLAIGVAGVSSAWAQPAADHLECYRVKDPQPKTTYVAELAGLAPEPGCLIRVPAKMACVPTSKTITSNPLPPGGGGTGSAGTFLCYSVKCPKGAPPALSMQDQFGSRTVEPRAPKVLCAPAVELIATTSTTSVPTTSTTSTTACGPGLTACGAECVDTQTDPSNCGDCDVVCSTDCSGDVTGTTCSAGTCAITSCSTNHYDVDALCENGCECIGQGVGGSFCGGSKSLGTVGVGGLSITSGNLPDGRQQWYQVTFASGGTPHITISGGAGTQFAFDVFSNCSTAIFCTPANQCSPPPGSTVQIGVRRTTAASCTAFTLTVGN
jgi:hypothetical protein